MVAGEISFDEAKNVIAILAGRGARLRAHDRNPAPCATLSAAVRYLERADDPAQTGA